jgi:hypothetical protein
MQNIKISGIIFYSERRKNKNFGKIIFQNGSKQTKKEITKRKQWNAFPWLPKIKKQIIEKTKNIIEYSGTWRVDIEHIWWNEGGNEGLYMENISLKIIREGIDYFFYFMGSCKPINLKGFKMSLNSPALNHGDGYLHHYAPPYNIP